MPFSDTTILKVIETLSMIGKFEGKKFIIIYYNIINYFL
jgi:hypothetical protein